MRPKRLIVVAGATATGKTAESIRIAKLLSTEIVSSDSRQFYKEMNIGVARPSHEELQSVPHHLIAHISTMWYLQAAADCTSKPYAKALTTFRKPTRV